MLRIAALLATLGGTLAAGPVAAQSTFGDAPPRPPADIPNGAFPAQPPPVRFPGQEFGAGVSGGAFTLRGPKAALAAASRRDDRPASRPRPGAAAR